MLILSPEVAKSAKAQERRERWLQKKREALYIPWRPDEAHAVVRARERFAMKLTPDRYANLCMRAVTGIRIGKARGSRVKMLFRFKQQWWLVAYDVSTARIVTFLPEAKKELRRLDKLVVKRYTDSLSEGSK